AECRGVPLAARRSPATNKNQYATEAEAKANLRQDQSRRVYVRAGVDRRRIPRGQNRKARGNLISAPSLQRYAVMADPPPARPPPPACPPPRPRGQRLWAARHAHAARPPLPP